MERERSSREEPGKTVNFQKKAWGKVLAAKLKGFKKKEKYGGALGPVYKRSQH